VARTKMEEYVLEEQVGHLMRLANQRITAIFTELFDKFDLTPLQFAVIIKLECVNEASQNHLGRMTGMDPNTARGVVQRLLERGIIVRRKSETDLRCLVLVLSNEGRKMARSIESLGLQVGREALSPLNMKERKTFLSMLKRLTF